MPTVPTRSEDDIFRGLVQRLAVRAGLTNVNATSTTAHLMGAAAREIATAYFDMVETARGYDWRNATGDTLTERAVEFSAGQVQRLPAQFAIGQITFSRTVATASPVTVPTGTRCKDPTTGLVYRTTEPATIAAFATSSVPAASARCETIGAVGNVGAGAVSELAGAVSGVNSASGSAFVFGADEESDESLRSRMDAYIASLVRCTPDALAFAVLGVEDPAGTGKTIRFSHTFEDPGTPGYVIVYVDDGTGAIAEYGTVEGILALTAVTDFAFAGTTVTLTSTGAFPATADTLVGREVVIQGASTGTNNGVFTILTQPDADTITYTNAAGFAELGGSAQLLVGECMTLGMAGPPTHAAVGGEEFISLRLPPVVDGLLNIVKLSSAGVLTALSRGTHYRVRLGNGQVVFVPPLDAGDRVIATYTYYTGAIQEAQKVIDGDDDDAGKYPGYVAAGIDARVQPPTTRPVTVSASLLLGTGADRTTAIAAARDVVTAYINSLTIGEDVILHELVERLMGVSGVTDVVISTPTANIPVNDHSVARVTAAALTIV